jgi:hypothetical protein
LTQAALAKFHDEDCDETALMSAPGPVVLYACGTHRLSAIGDNFQVARSDAHYVQFEIELSGVNEAGFPITLDEHVSIGPGVPVGSQAAATQVILDDSSS